MAGSQEDPILTKNEEGEESKENEDEDTGAQIAPIVKLEEVAVSTGEEEEDVLLDMKAKLYRFDKDGNQWKERGVGTVKLLKHKETGKVRLVMRQSKTLKICANHLILASMSLQEHAGSDKSWVWHATDFSDGELKDELFCIRLGSVENAKKFKEMFEEVAESQAKSSQEGEVAAESATELIKSLKIEDKKEEPKEESKVEEKKEDKSESGEKPTEPSSTEAEKEA
uniref:RanBD1 domain-containing protein n=1 Tax=Araucaria cunninghamii TaxID=56994 RepID=A0A0D6R0V4_ARACU